MEDAYFKKLFNINQKINLNADLITLNLYNLYGQKIIENVKFIDVINVYLLPGLYLVRMQNDKKIFKTVKIWLPIN